MEQEWFQATPTMLGQSTTGRISGVNLRLDQHIARRCSLSGLGGRCPYVGSSRRTAPTRSAPRSGETGPDGPPAAQSANRLRSQSGNPVCRPRPAPLPPGASAGFPATVPPLALPANRPRPRVAPRSAGEPAPLAPGAVHADPVSQVDV